ncbi:unnamed protein product [Prunus brigantina]
MRPNPSAPTLQTAPFYSDLESIDELCDLGSRFWVQGQCTCEVKRSRPLRLWGKKS